MADISVLSRLVAGFQRSVDLSQNSLIVGSIKIGTSSPVEITKAIATKLIAVQAAADSDGTFDTRYTKISNLASTSVPSGATLVGVSGTPTNFTPVTPTVQGFFNAIDTALGATSGAATDLSNLTSTAINQSLLPGVDNSIDLGSAAKRWANAAIENIKNNKIDIYDSAISVSTGLIQGDAGGADVWIKQKLITGSGQSIGLIMQTSHNALGDATGTKGIQIFTGDKVGGTGDTGNIQIATGTSTGGTRGTLYLGGDTVQVVAPLDVNSNQISNVADPTTAQQAATKAYVDSVLDGRSWKQPVRVASTANIDLSVAADPSPIDGITLADNDRILLKNQTSGAENGIYTAVDADDPTTWVRASDANSALELEGAAVFVEEGTANHDFQYAQTADSITLNTTPLVWTVTSANSFSGHDMVTVTGGQISVDLSATSGLKSTNPGNAAGQLSVKLEASNPSLQVDGSNQLGAKLDAAGTITSGASGLKVGVDNSTVEINSNALRVKDAGITLAKMASNSVDENKIVSTAFNAAGAITGGGGSKLAVQVDGSSVEINSNALRVKSTAYDQSTITGGSGSAATVDHSPLVQAPRIAGESLADDVTFALRMAVNGETLGRLYKADKDATSSNLFFVLGLARKVGGATAGNTIQLFMLGSYTLGANDTPFSSSDIGLPVYLSSAGALTLTPPSTVNEAVYKIGVVEATTKIFVGNMQLHGIN